MDFSESSSGVYFNKNLSSNLDEDEKSSGMLLEVKDSYNKENFNPNIQQTFLKNSKS